MDLERFDEKHVRVTDTNGDEFTGVADFFDAEYARDEWGIDGECVRVDGYFLPASRIASIEETEVHGTAELRTERLILRRFTTDDAPALYEAFAGDPYASEAEAAEAVHRILEGYESGGAYAWVLDFEDVLFGTIVAKDRGDGTFEVRVRAVPACRRQGCDAEALKAVLVYLTENEGIPLVTARCPAGDAGMKGTLEGAGMRPAQTETTADSGDTTYEYRKEQQAMDSENSVKIAYAPVEERTFPEKVFFKAFLEAPNFAKTKTKGLFKGSKEGLFHILKGQILPPEYDGVEDAGFGAALAKKGKNCFLYNAAGEALASGDCTGVKVLSETMFAKQCGGKWGVYSLVNGAELLPCRYDSVSEISEESFVLREGKDSFVAGLDGKPILPGPYTDAHPFLNGFARVSTKEGTQYVSREGKVIYEGAGADSRDFCNGFAVIADKKGKLGAIDTEGRVIVQPQYLFMRDFGDGFFLCSNTGTKGPDGNFNGRDYGAINAAGKIVVPLSKLFIAPHGEGKIMFGRGEIWQVTSGNTRTAYRVAIMGVADLEGKVLLPEKYAYIGPESDGLIPFKSFENKIMTLGYMRPDGTTALVIARHDYESDVTDRPALRADTAEQIGPFVDGKARVTVRKSNRVTGLFDRVTRESVVNAAAPYWIDKEGNETTAPEKKEGAALSADDLMLCEDLPFVGKIKALQPAYRAMYVKLRPFGIGGMTELTAGEHSFAIFGADGRLACAKWDGTDLKAIPKPAHGEYSTLSPAGNGLWAGLRKSADGKTDKPVFWISEFESPTVFGDGLAPFCTGEGKNKLWGYTDLLGNAVVEPKYKEATGFEYGRAYAVKPDGTEAILSRVLLQA